MPVSSVLQPCPPTPPVPSRLLRHQEFLLHAGQKPDLLWICKPAAGCCGRGIFMVQEPQALDTKTEGIVQEYIMRPLLLSGCKFDLRMYLCVVRASPLLVYYRNGYVRRRCVALGALERKFLEEGPSFLLQRRPHSTYSAGAKSSFGVPKLPNLWVIDQGCKLFS